MAMAQLRLWLLVCASLSSLLIVSSASLSLVPAFVWSNTRNLDNDGQQITYETLSSEHLAEAVINEFGFPESQEESSSVDMVIVFIGNKLRSVDISRAASSASTLLPVIQGAVTKSKSSIAIPYVTPLKNKKTFSDVLLSTFLRHSELESRAGDIVTAGSCGFEASGVKKVSSIQELKEYLSMGKERKVDKKTDLVIVCSSFASEPSKPVSEGELLEDVLGAVDESKATYVASYVTDFVTEIDSFPSRGRQLGNVLRVGNESFCDGVCRTKATMLEGIFVGITLLIILISGICCMAGITSPSRFEQAKES